MEPPYTDIRSFIQSEKGKKILKENQGIKADPTNFTSRYGFLPSGASTVEVTFEGLGKAIISKNSYYESLKNDLQVEIDAQLPPGEGAKRVQQILSLLGCGPILGIQREEDAKKIQLMILFRTYFPFQANKLENSDEFPRLTFEELTKRVITTVNKIDPKAEIERIEQERKNVEKNISLLRAEQKQHIALTIEKYKALFVDEASVKKHLKTHTKQVEVFPGKITWASTDIADQIRAAGGIGLMSGVTAVSVEGAVKTLSHILKGGMLASKNRFEAGMIVPGASSEDDLRYGGGNQVFTRLINENNKHYNINQYPFANDIQILYDLSTVELGAYAYERDIYGSKVGDTYKKRNNLAVFATMADRTDNEVMIKDRIPPSHICGLAVNIKMKEQILAGLREEGLIVKDEKGVEVINQVPVDQFIHFVDPDQAQFQSDWWNQQNKQQKT